MKLNFDNAKIMQDGQNWLCLQVKNIQQARAFIDNKKDMQYLAEIKQYHPKRSLNANAYAWVLITKIANILRADKNDTYVQMLDRYGQSQVVSVIEQGADLFKRTVKYYVEVGESALNGKNFVHLRVLTGSSEFDSREMAIFIDGLVSECKMMNIDVMNDSELDLLKSGWKE